MRTWLATILIAGLGAAPLRAQYIAPGSSAPVSGIPSKKDFEKRIDESLWKLGPVRLNPWLGVQDAQFVRNTSSQGSESETDFTATIGAGLRAYVPTGRVVWSAHLLPEYVSWQDNEIKAGLNGRLGLGVFGYFNRLTVAASRSTQARQSFFSQEIEELTTTRSDSSRFSVEAALGRRISMFGSATLLELENQEEENPVFSLLDREEEMLELGLRYASPQRWTVSLAYQDQSTDFSEDGRELSNSGTVQSLHIGLNRSRINFRLALELTDLEGDEGSEFGNFDETTGLFEVLLNLSGPFDTLLYSRRSLSYSIRELNSFILTQRNGVRLDFGFRRGAIGVFAEIGEDELGAIDSGGRNQIEDVTALGANLRLELGTLLVSVEAIRTEHDSPLAVGVREVTTVGITVELGLGRVIEKLRLGSSEGDW